MPPALAIVLAMGAFPRGAAAGPRHITNGIEETFRQVTAPHALDGVVPPGWKLESFAAGTDKLDLIFADGAANKHSIALLLDAPPGLATVGQGKNFRYHFTAGAESPDDAAALLHAARIVDAATPPGAIFVEKPVEQRAFEAPPQSLDAAHLPTWAGVALGALQCLLILGAILASLLAPTRRKEIAAQAPAPDAHQAKSPGDLLE